MGNRFGLKKDSATGITKHMFFTGEMGVEPLF